MRRTIAVTAVLLAVWMTPAWAETDINELADAHPKGDVQISNVSGLVNVTGWDREQVEVTGTLGRGTERLLFAPEGKHTEIKVIVPRDSHRVEGSDLEIRVPEGSRVSINTVSADVTVKGVTGALRIQSVSGEIEAEVFGEDVETKTVSGDFRIRGHDNPALLVLTTVSGDGRVHDIRGELVVQSVTGDLEIESSVLDRARLRTTNGDIELKTALGDDARFDMEAINGDLRLDILGDISAEFDLETFNGSIDNSFGPDATRISKYTPGKELRFSQGDGNARVRIKTLNGSIHLRGG